MSNVPFTPLYAGIRRLLPKMLGNHAALVYIALLSRRGADGRCDPSVATICEDTGMTRDRTVQAALSQLEAIGAIGRQRRAGHTDNFTFPVLDIRDTVPPTPSVTPKQRDLLKLKTALPNSEAIASYLGIPLQSVHERVSRLQRAIRDQVNERRAA